MLEDGAVAEYRTQELAVLGCHSCLLVDDGGGVGLAQAQAHVLTGRACNENCVDSITKILSFYFANSSSHCPFYMYKFTRLHSCLPRRRGEGRGGEVSLLR